MKPQDTERFARVMAALGETFNETISDIRSEAYFGALDDLPMEQVELAATMWIRRGKFFPKPVELRELIEGAHEDLAQLGWIEMIGEIRRVGWYGTPRLSEATLATIEGLWGSWKNLCQTLPGEGPELLGWQKRWESAYGATAGQLERGELIGRDEAKRILGIYLGPQPEQLPEADAREVPSLSHRQPTPAHDHD